MVSEQAYEMEADEREHGERTGSDDRIVTNIFLECVNPVHLDLIVHNLY